ncbi:DMT family transporter [Falsirhodobacter halotolerans]|uniref:DMT family transporter n=1 Tax=Falsirhodobacter halotolerans TaxID=1146892 RepID=UPI001FD28068|nr:DMT family transporter [Falsirhodobacter halotolerans]MCJ8140483.1 DMT family transporter [Falsirhodobacter halotolerans]
MRDRPVQGVLWMLVSGLSFVAVNGAVRAAGSDVPSIQAAFLRYAFGIVFLAPLLPTLIRARFPSHIWWLFTLRGAFHSAAVVGWFYAMVHIPIAEVSAIGYLTPIAVVAGGALIFGERFSLRRAAAIGVAILGTLIVLRPGLREVELGHLSQLFAALMFAVSYLIAKRLSREVPPALVVAMMSISVAVVLAVPAMMVWVPPSMGDLAWFAMAAVFATSGHYCMTRSFGCAPLTTTQPVTFLQLIWATLLGVLVFGEAVDPFVLLGGGMIIAAIAYITWRDAVRARQMAPQARI